MSEERIKKPENKIEIKKWIDDYKIMIEKSKWYLTTRDVSAKLEDMSDMIFTRECYIKELNQEMQKKEAELLKKDAEIERLKEELYSLTGKEAQIEIKEIKNLSLDAQLVSENIAFQLEKRIPHRRAMKKAIQAVFNVGGKGIKMICSGRLAGAEIARSESYRVGKIPSQTLRADVDYGFSEARTQYGAIGVKVWIYKGDKVLDGAETKEGQKANGPDAKKSKI